MGNITKLEEKKVTLDLPEKQWNCPNCEHTSQSNIGRRFNKCYFCGSVLEDIFNRDRVNVDINDLIGKLGNDYENVFREKLGLELLEDSHEQSEPLEEDEEVLENVGIEDFI